MPRVHEARSGSLFEPDALLPAQFYAAFGRGSSTQGEKRLMAAVLQEAVDCYQKYARERGGRGRQFFVEAEEWILSRDRTWPFSFENICETLELNPGYLRRGLRAWVQRQGISVVVSPHTSNGRSTMFTREELRNVERAMAPPSDEVVIPHRILEAAQQYAAAQGRFTASELRTKLSSRGYSEVLLTAVIEKLETKGVITAADSGGAHHYLAPTVSRQPSPPRPEAPPTRPLPSPAPGSRPPAAAAGAAPLPASTPSPVAPRLVPVPTDGGAADHEACVQAKCRRCRKNDVDQRKRATGLCPSCNVALSKYWSGRRDDRKGHDFTPAEIDEFIARGPRVLGTGLRGASLATSGSPAAIDHAPADLVPAQPPVRSVARTTCRLHPEKPAGAAGLCPSCQQECSRYFAGRHPKYARFTTDEVNEFVLVRTGQSAVGPSGDGNGRSVADADVVALPLPPRPGPHGGREQWQQEKVRYVDALSKAERERDEARRECAIAEARRAKAEAENKRHRAATKLLLEGFDVVASVLDSRDKSTRDLERAHLKFKRALAISRGEEPLEGGAETTAEGE